MNDQALVIGEALVDVVVDTAGSSHEHVGGSPANVAIGLGRLDRPVTLITTYGDDARGRMIDARLVESGVRTSGGLRAGETTSTAIATLDASGAAHYDFDIRWDPRPPSLDGDALVVHTGSLGAYLDPGHDVVVELLEAHRASATITFDPNLRPSLMTLDLARERVARIIEMADVVKVSDEDLAWLLPGSDPELVLREWLAAGPSLVVLTRGAAGADAFTTGASAHVDRLPVTVVDTVGAGDSFMSGLIDGLWIEDALGATGPAAIAALTPDRLHGILTHANQSAAFTVSRAGAEPPTAAELRGA